MNDVDFGNCFVYTRGVIKSSTIKRRLLMKSGRFTAIVVCFSTMWVATATAQFYVAPNIGFKSFGLNGATTSNVGGTINQLGVFDAGKSSFHFGAGVGYTVLPAGVYNLDVGLDFGYSSAGFVEEGNNSRFGAGSFAAGGYSGATTTDLSFDLKSIHRINIPGFDLISPFAGVGMAFNMFSTSDMTIGAPTATPPVTVTGTSQFKIGLAISYGASVKIGMLSPFIQLKHYVPFSSEFQFTDSPNGTVVIQDSPGYFSLSAGVRLGL